MSFLAGFVSSSGSAYASGSGVAGPNSGLAILRLVIRVRKEYSLSISSDMVI